jgi:hypothetical protein
MSRRIENGPSLAILKQRATVRLLFQKVASAVDAGNYPLAQKLFDKMLASGATRSEVGLDRSKVYEKQAQPKLAYLALKDSIGEYKPGTAAESWQLAKLGEWARQYGAEQEALDDYHRVIADYNGKLRSGEKPIDEAALSREGLRATALSLDALAATEEGQGRSGVSLAKTAVGLSPNLSLSHFALGVSMLQAQGNSVNLEFGTEPVRQFQLAYSMASADEYRRMQWYLLAHGIARPN